MQPLETLLLKVGVILVIRDHVRAARPYSKRELRETRCGCVLTNHLSASERRLDEERSPLLLELRLQLHNTGASTLLALPVPAVSPGTVDALTGDVARRSRTARRGAERGYVVIVRGMRCDGSCTDGPIRGVAGHHVHERRAVAGR